jgi:ribonuclease HII
MFNVQQKIKKISKKNKIIIGCDEVGRGCLAGPVVAAAVAFEIEPTLEWTAEIKDSKKLSAKKREELAPLIRQSALGYAVAEVEPGEIDRINIHNASLLAMRKAVEKLLSETGVKQENAYLYIDGKFMVPNINIEQEAVVGGDDKIFEVACASIIAKVYRDNLITKLDSKYPGYDFVRHKGYATKHHVSQIKTQGLSPIHRLSFCGKII